ncbi:MAG: hypothetical protein ACI80V_003408 [Rhodothermales bacterium]
MRAGGRVARSHVQRLGWLLDLLEETALAAALAGLLEGKRLLSTLLAPSRDGKDSNLNRRWRVLVNDDAIFADDYRHVRPLLRQ